MLYIVTCCHCGVGTSAFSRKLVYDAVEELGYKKEEVKVECTEILSVKGMKPDVIVTQKVLMSKMPPVGGKLKAVIGVKSLVKDKESMIEGLRPVLEQANQEGLISKIG